MATEEPGTRQNNSTHKEPTAGQTLVLVAETDPAFRRLLKYFLEEGGYAVVFADDGYVALDRIRLSKPGLLITEILLPHLDGLSLCRLLKGDPVTSDVPILVYSVLDADARARGSGANAFMKKPIEKKRLMNLVGSLCPAQTVQEDA